MQSCYVVWLQLYSGGVVIMIVMIIGTKFNNKSSDIREGGQSVGYGIVFL